MSSSPVVYEKDGPIGRITLSRPEKRNPLDLETLKSIISTFKKSGDNGDLAVIFTSSGKDFSVGVNLKYVLSILGEKRNLTEAMGLVRAFQDVTRAIRDHPGAVIGGLKGLVIGGAFEMTLACDLRIASKDTVIMMPEMGIATLLSNASNKLLPQLIGEAKAKELVFLGPMVSAEEALRLGLVNSVRNPEYLVKELENTARTIAKKAPMAIRLTKRLMNQSWDMSIDAALDAEEIATFIMGQSEDFMEALKAFAEKREPQFRGK
nr:enoyl-CoA hydratase/isomerase family protein [Candidatus Njordarchaeum guaymaensis]